MIRALLVDNHDSFTYNLSECLYAATGTRPTVVRNDDPGFGPADALGFDCVVISPGPGHPAIPANLGLAAELIRRAERPLLGVCLGHQAIAHLHGGTVAPAPEPRHGRTSAIHHDGTGLFAGLPSPFTAVRYHSLAVTQLPSALEPLAHSDDRVLMALRHRALPLWGVQFHPESIASEGGRLLLGRFIELAGQWWSRAGGGAQQPGARAGRAGRGAPSAAGRRGAHRHQAADGEPPATAEARRPGPVPANGWTVLRQRVRLPAGVDGERIFDALFRAGEHPFWLDSSLPGPPMGRFSVLGDASGELARIARADVRTGTVSVQGACGAQRVSGPFLDWLAADLRAHRPRVVELAAAAELAHPADPADAADAADAADRGSSPGLSVPADDGSGFTLGWVGYLGYELKAECGGEVGHPSPYPDAVLVFPQRAVVLDHLTGTASLLVLSASGDDAAARARLSALRAELLAVGGRAGGLDSGPSSPGPPRLGQGSTAGLRLRHGPEEYLRLIEACQAQIRAGESYEVCLTNQVISECRPEPWAAYRRLRRMSPAPFGAYLQFGGLHLLSTSPERFLQVRADGRVESKPIKGTRPRGADPVEDEALRDELLSSAKDRAENLMIVDLVRNDLARHAEPGSVAVPRAFAVEGYRTVHQLVSTVTAQLAEGSSAVDAVRAAFPPGSMTGAPKERTMEIIDRLEGAARGPYSGALGYFSLSGATELSVVIRTLVIDDTGLRYGVGGAIVALSDPEAEYEETAVKAESLLRLLGAQFPARRPRRGVGAPVVAGR